MVWEQKLRKNIVAEDIHFDTSVDFFVCNLKHNNVFDISEHNYRAILLGIDNCHTVLAVSVQVSENCEALSLKL